MPRIPISIYTREVEYLKDGFVVTDKKKEIMMCSYCNVRIDWKRKDSCDKHCHDSAVHKQKKLEAGKKRQPTLEHTFQQAKKMKDDKKEFITDTCAAFLKANIPLEKLDSPHLGAWMNKYIKGAGDLPTASTMRGSYIPKVREIEEERLKQTLAGKKVGILADETTNRKGECVFVVLVKPLECNEIPKLYVGGVKLLENANSKECSRAIMEVLNKLCIQYEDVLFVASDAARYMTKCFETLSGLLGEPLIHIQCWAHKLNLLGNICQEELAELNECISKSKMAFLNTRKRKNLYLYYLKENSDKHAKLFPSPVMTRWNSWFFSVEYVAEYMTELVAFFRTLDEGGAAVVYFKQLTAEAIQIIQVQATFVADHCKATVDLIKELEGNSYPLSHRITAKVADLLNSFSLVAERHFGPRTTEAVATLRAVAQHSTKAKLASVGARSRVKLTTLVATDPAKAFFKAMGKLFDPRNISNVTNEDVLRYGSKIPFVCQLSNNVQMEGHLALKNLARDLISEGQEVDVLPLLLSLKSDHEDYVNSVVKVMWVPPSNVDSERAFSSYGNILTDRRTTLKPENIELMLSMTFGSN